MLLALFWDILVALVPVLESELVLAALDLWAELQSPEPVLVLALGLGLALGLEPGLAPVAVAP